MKNIRKAVTRAIRLAAITAALAVAPMALTPATAGADSVNWDAIAVLAAELHEFLGQTTLGAGLH